MQNIDSQKQLDTATDKQTVAEKDIIRWYLLVSRTPVVTKELLEKYMTPISREVRRDFREWKEVKEDEYKKRKKQAKLDGKVFDEEYVAPKLPFIEEIFVPNKISIYNHALRKPFFLREYVFVKTSLASLQTISEFDTPLKLETISPTNPKPTFADDNSIQIIKFAYDNQLQPELLQNYNKDLAWCDYVVVHTEDDDNSEDIEGHVASIGRMGYKLIFDLFNWRLLVPNIMKWDVEIVANNATRLSKESAAARLAYYFLEKMKGRLYNLFANKLAVPVEQTYASNVEAPKELRSIMLTFGNRLRLKQYATELAQSTSKHSTKKDKVRFTFLSSFSPNDYNKYETLLSYLWDTVKGNISLPSGVGKEDIDKTSLKPLLMELIPDIPFRPFLTPTADDEFTEDKDYHLLPVQSDAYQEYSFRTEIKEGTWREELHELAYVKRQYFANVAVINDYDGGKLLFTSWPGFMDDVFKSIEEKGKDEFFFRLYRFKMHAMLKVMKATLDEDDKDSIQFYVLPEYHTSGLGLHISSDDNIVSKAEDLVNCGVGLCKAIMHNSHFRPWQHNLTATWIRHTYPWEKTDAEIFDWERQKMKQKNEKMARTQAQALNKVKKTIKKKAEK